MEDPARSKQLEEDPLTLISITAAAILRSRGRFDSARGGSRYLAAFLSKF